MNELNRSAVEMGQVCKIAELNNSAVKKVTKVTKIAVRRCSPAERDMQTKLNKMKSSAEERGQVEKIAKKNISTVQAVTKLNNTAVKRCNKGERGLQTKLNMFPVGRMNEMNRGAVEIGQVNI